jgi:hypothetical protein
MSSAMSRVLPFLPLLILTAPLFAQQPTLSPAPGTPSFSFEKVMVPSLADINAGKFKKPLQGNRLQLINVDALFDRNLTWYEDSRVYAVFDGEEAKVENAGRGIEVGTIAKIREVWGRNGNAMVLLSKSSTPIDRKDVRHLTFR